MPFWNRHQPPKNEEQPQPKLRFGGLEFTPVSWRIEPTGEKFVSFRARIGLHTIRISLRPEDYSEISPTELKLNVSDAAAKEYADLLRMA